MGKNDSKRHHLIAWNASSGNVWWGELAEHCPELNCMFLLADSSVLSCYCSLSDTHFSGSKGSDAKTIQGLEGTLTTRWNSLIAFKQLGLAVHFVTQLYYSISLSGNMFPTIGDVHLAPFTDEQLYMEQFTKANFWWVIFYPWALGPAVFCHRKILLFF